MAEPWVLVAAGSIPAAGGALELDPEEGRHVARVLRRGVGSILTLCDGRGAVAEARISSVRRDRVGVEVLETSASPPPSGPAVDVALAVLHTAAMDWAVQKTTEVGARALVPVIAERSQLAVAAARRRVPHWRRCARQALKQCRRRWEMAVEEPVELATLLAAPTPGRIPVIADPEGVPVGLLPRDRDLILVVGPEGGLGDRELELVARAGCPRVRLGPHLLRSETAAVIGAAALLALLAGDLER